VRVVRGIVGVLLALVGLIVAVVGGVAAFWLIGPDDTVHSGEQRLSSKGLAVASTPDLLNRHGPVLHVAVRSAKDQPVFVGVARDLDVTSYLKGTAHTKLVQVQFPIALPTQDEKGTAGPLAAPNTLDWWVAKASGAGTQSIAWPIEDGPYDVVIMNADGKTAPDVQVDLGVEIPKAFVTALVIFAVGIVLLALGILLVLLRRRTPKPQLPSNTTYLPDGAPPQYSVGTGAPPGSGGAVRRVVAIATAFGLVTGCSAIPQPDSVTVLARPSIGDSAAVAVIKHYNDVNNKANSTRDRDLIATVEGGDLLRQSRAWYAIAKASKAKPSAAFTYTEPLIGAPQSGSYPMRFVSSSGISGNKEYRHLGVWERESAGSPWLLTFAAAPKATVKLPDLIGLRPAVKADDTALAAAPQAAATSLATYLTGGAKSPRAAAFQPNPEITSLLTEIVENRTYHLKTRGTTRGVTDMFTAPTQAPAFVTKSGTAVVFVTLTHDYTLLPTNHYRYSWAVMPYNAFSPAEAEYYGALTSKTLHSVVLLIPPKGKGKIQVAAFESQLVDAGGY
jgi:hypothetical protein